MADGSDKPLFSAVSPSARQLYALLRCISFTPKVQVRLTAEGIRFSSADSSVMEGKTTHFECMVGKHTDLLLQLISMTVGVSIDADVRPAFVFLSKSLFSSYHYNDNSSPHDLPEDLPPPPSFEISLQALLETLQIFSLSDPNSQKGTGSYDTFAAHRLNRHANIPFASSVLGTTGLCRLSYTEAGSPLSIHLSEAGVRTTCDLTTYDASHGGADGNELDIPFDRDALAFKTIMRSSHLADAISELGSTSPDNIHLLASHDAPYLSLSSEGGPLGSATVTFTKDTQLLETFLCPRRLEARYAFHLVKAAYRAMTSASKVSIRADRQGVLSLQFLVEVENAGAAGSREVDARESVAFVDFRIVPLAENESDAADSSAEEDEN